MFDRSIDPTYESVSLTRNEARHALDLGGVPDAVAAEIELVMSELMSNAVDQNPSLPVWVGLAIADRTVYLAVANQSAGQPSASHQPEPALNPSASELPERGRGLPIVHALVDGLWITDDTSWTLVSCVRRFS